MNRRALIPAALCTAALLLQPLPCFAEEETAGDNAQSLGSGGMYFAGDYSFEYSYINSDTEISITSCSKEAVTVEIPLTIDDLPVTEIGEGAFYQCYDMTSVTMSDRITVIQPGAFFGCESLTDITLSDQLTSIGYQAFYGCSALTEISLPAALTTIDSGVWEGCSALAAITVDTDNTVYSSLDGVLYNRDQTVLIKYPEGAAQTEFSVPDTVTEIRDNACYGSQQLETITLPASLEQLGSYVFEGCPALKSIQVDQENETYTAIDGVLFTKDLTTLIKFPEQCELTDYTVPDATTRLEDWSFVGAERLESIHLNQVQEIGEDCFYYCTALKSVTIPEAVTELNGACFAYCTALTEVTLPKGLQKIGAYCFVNCTALKTITLPGSLTDIGAYALGFTYDNETGESARRDDFSLTASVGSVGADYAKEYEIPYQKTGMTIALIIGGAVLVIIIAAVTVATISRRRAMQIRPAKTAARKDTEHE